MNERRSIRAALLVLLGLAGVARAGSFDSFGEQVPRSVVAGDETSSVIIGDHGGVVDSGSADAGSGWTVADDGAGPAFLSETQTACPKDPCAEPACPPWNGVPGLINSHLGAACPRLVWSVDALMLWQGNVASRPLFIDPGATATVLDVNQINAPVSVGPRVDLIINLNQCHGIEANWFDVQPFEGSNGVAPGVAPYSMNNIAGMTASDIDTAVASQSAAFKSFELNWRRRTCSPLTWLAGFRWVEWDQSLNVVDTYGAGSGFDSTAVLTGNNLYGGQIGVDALLWNTGRWLTFNGIAKAGAFYNYNAYQRTELMGDREFGGFSAADDGTAFVGEVGINGTVQILHWLSWRAGYNFFWLSGVAVPASQLSITNQPATSLNLDGSVFLHGVNTGLEARW